MREDDLRQRAPEMFRDWFPGFTPLTPSSPGWLNPRKRGCQCGIGFSWCLCCHNLARRLLLGRNAVTHAGRSNTTGRTQPERLSHAKTNGCHQGRRGRNALEEKRCSPALPPRPTNTHQKLPTPKRVGALTAMAAPRSPNACWLFGYWLLASNSPPAIANGGVGGYAVGYA